MVQRRMFERNVKLAPGKSERVLSFDCGTRIGWAFFTVAEDGTVANAEVGSVRLAGDEVGRFIHFESVLYELVERFRPTRIAYEHVDFAKGPWLAQFWGYRTVLVMAGRDLTIPVLKVKPGEVKRAATGNGSANKPEIMANAALVLGHPVRNDNEADALYAGFAGARREP